MAAPVDLRSDTVTRPSAAMRRAMADAEVGDDGYGEDPTVCSLEERFAARVGKAAAVFVPSGTMGNQIALRLLGAPGTAVVAGAGAHVVRYEQGAAGTNAYCQLLTVDDTDGTVPAHALAAAIEAGVEHHQPKVSAVCIENSHMPSGGTVWSQDRLAALAAVARPAGVAVHLDGARLFNAEVATGVPAAELAAGAATVMCCLSKGLGAPVGSLLAGAADVIDAARGERKRLGGAMRQAGIVAAAGLVALDRNVERLADDHARARRLVDAVGERWPACGLDPATAATNVVVFAPPDPAGLLAHLAVAGVRAATIAVGVVRLVTHLDVDDEGIDRTVAALRSSPS